MRKTMALLAALLLMLSLFAGCNNDTSGTDNSSQSATPAADPSVSNEGSTHGSDGLELPLADDVVEFEAFMFQAMPPASGITSFGESSAYKELERRTNVKINFFHPVDSREAFNLLFTSNDLPDTINAASMAYVGGVDKYIDEGFILDLASMIDKYAPNYNSMRNLTDIVCKSTMTDTGRVPALWIISPTMQTAFYGPIVNQTWLDEIGHTDPIITYDDWHEVLTKFKGKASTAPLYLCSNVGLDPGLLAGFGVTQTGFLISDGKVEYGFTSDGFYDYLSTISQWFAEDLIDPNYFSRQTFYTDFGLFANGDFGMMHHVYTFVDIIELVGAPNNVKVTALQPPVVKKGDRIVTNWGNQDTQLGMAMATITSQCKDPELLLRWYDYLFTDEGALLANYGVAGEAYNIVDGEIVQTDLILNNPEGINSNEARSRYAFAPYIPFRYEWERELPSSSEKAVAASLYWEEAWDRENSNSLPEITLTSEESAKFNALYGDIQTFVNESVAQFITGSKPLSEWDAYVQQIKNMDIQTCLDIYQDAYERFFDRGE